MPQIPPRSVTRRAVLSGSLAALMLGLSACTDTSPQAAPSGPGNDTPQPIRTFRFAATATPVTLDPATAGDNDSFQVTRQIYETLVSIDPNTGGPVAGLAESWTESEDGLRYTFTLRRGVRFHDGEEFNAHAVVANFERWLSLNEELRARSLQGFTQVFHHTAQLPQLPATDAEAQAPEGEQSLLTEEQRTVKENQDTQLAAMRILFEKELFTGDSQGGSASYFKSVSATDDYTVTLNLRRKLTGVIEAFTLPGMAIASPAALVGGPKDQPARDLATAPIGTGPYRFVEQTPHAIKLELNQDYWNQARITNNPAHPQSVEISATASPQGRQNKLLAGELDAFDLVSVDILKSLVRNARVVVQRDPFSVLYLGLHHNAPWLEKPDFRRALAHAIDKGRMVRELFMSGAKSAGTILPPTFAVENPSNIPFYDPEKSREILAELDYQGQEIQFAYPLRVSRNYLSLPEKVFAFIAEDLAAVGIKVKPVPYDWSVDNYARKVRYDGGFKGLHLLGLTGAYRNEDNFISGILTTKEHEFGYTSPLLDAQVLAARSIPVGEERAAAYQQILTTLSHDLPLVPLVFPISALAVNSNVNFYPSSPVLNEVWVDVQMSPSTNLVG